MTQFCPPGESVDLSCRNPQDTLVGGDHRSFVFIAARPDISMQNVELYLHH